MMFNFSWGKVLASLEESTIGAEHFARTLFETRDSLPSEHDSKMLDALISARSFLILSLVTLAGIFPGTTCPAALIQLMIQLAPLLLYNLAS
jgi:hypothetical protein